MESKLFGIYFFPKPNLSTCFVSTDKQTNKQNDLSSIWKNRNICNIKKKSNPIIIEYEYKKITNSYPDITNKQTNKQGNQKL